MNAMEVAKKMETDAIRFYAEAAEKTQHPAGKKMFQTIVKDEKRHLELVTNMLKGMDVHVGDVHPIKNVQTVFEEMKDEMMERVKATSDDLEAFKIGMEMEKEGLEFYKKLLSEAKTEKEKEIYTKLMHEEEEHYKIFANSYEFLNDTGNWYMWDEHTIVEG